MDIPMYYDMDIYMNMYLSLDQLSSSVIENKFPFKERFFQHLGNYVIAYCPQACYKSFFTLFKI